MKRLLLIAALIVLFIIYAYWGTKPDYKKLAIEYLKTQIHNPESIETIKWGNLDTSYATSYSEIYKLNRLQSDTFKLKRDYFLYKSKQISDKDSSKRYLKLSKFFNTEDSILTSVMKKNPKTSSHYSVWAIYLTYKAKDKHGVVRLDTCKFTFNKELTEVNFAEGIDL